MKNEASDKTSRLIVIVCVVIVVLWIVLGWILPLLLSGDEKRWSDVGSLGDSFGMVNSLFSGFALAGVVLAIWLQSKEYRQQLREFSAQTTLQEKNLKHQIAATETQTEMSRQQFDHQLASSKQQNELARQQFEHQLETSQVQNELAREQLALMAEERKLREEEYLRGIEPLFMLRIEESDSDFTFLKLYNGGAPVFDLKMLGDQSAEFENDEGKRSHYDEILDRQSPAKIYVERIGLGSSQGGSVSFEYTRFDKQRKQVALSWSTGRGLGAEPNPRSGLVEE